MTQPAFLRLSGKFAERDQESAFQRGVAQNYYKHNSIAIAIALPLNAVYAYFDLSVLEDPDFATQARLLGVSACVLLFAAFRLQIGRTAHEYLTALIVLILGAVMNAIMFHEPTLENDYYVGLIQGGVFVSFLVRIGFLKLASVMAATLATFVVIAQAKGPPEDAYLQITGLTTMYVLCGFGAYLLERHARTEFLQSRTIARQNEQLARLLADVRLDNERKLAALNVLVHFVRTPIHQIVGFTGVIAEALKEMADPQAAAQLEHAEFVRRASADLSSNVAKVLVYYRLDEQMKTAVAEKAPIDQMLQDLKDEIGERTGCSLEGKAGSAATYLEPFRAALSAIAAYYRQDGVRASQVWLRIDRDDAGLVLRIEDDGAPLGADAFAEQTKPLTKIDNYLTTDGSAMPMALRTAARAAELCGGAIDYRLEENRNIFMLRFADLSAKIGAAA